jgi:PAS domain S-box-containing protein
MIGEIRPMKSRARDAWKVAEPVPVLIVDDDADKRLALRSILSSLDYAIVEADSAVAALRCVMAQDFAVILLDVSMPITDGFETAALIRKRKQSEATPIVFITALAGDELAATDRYAGGAVDFMFAPVATYELQAKVAAFANIFDCTQELARQAADLQAQADQLRLVTDAAPVAIFQTDADNCYVYTNPCWTEITGVPAAIAHGQAWDIILGSDERDALLAELPVGVAHHSELAHRFGIRSPGHGPRAVLVTSRPIPDPDGEISGWVGTITDVVGDAATPAEPDAPAEIVMSEANR